jgi:hypothetical protein
MAVAETVAAAVAEEAVAAAAVAAAWRFLRLPAAEAPLHRAARRAGGRAAQLQPPA